MAKLSPLIAPIVTDYLARRLGGAGASGTAVGGSSSTGALIEILNSILRQAQSSGQTAGNAGGSAGGFDLGSILGGLLGAGRH